MKATIHADTEHQLINVVLEGTIDTEAGAQIRADTLHTAEEHGFHRLLFDARKASLDFKTTDLHEFAAKPETEGVTRQYKRAIVHSGQEDDFRFYETVSINRGYTVRHFTDTKEAVTWLTQEEDTR